MLLGGPSCPGPGQPRHGITVGITVGMASAGTAIVAVADVTLLMWASPPQHPCRGITAVASLLRALPPWHHCLGIAALALLSCLLLLWALLLWALPWVLSLWHHCHVTLLLWI